MSELPEHPAEAIACSDCGLVQMLSPVPANRVPECARCGHDLAASSTVGIEVPLAFSAAALLLLLPSTLAPLMSLVSFGVERRDWIPTGVGVLWNYGYAPLATVVFLFSIAIPFIYLGLMVWVLAASRLGVAMPLGRAFRWAGELRPWAMIEVYLVGCCVAYTRLQPVGNVHMGIGGWCLIGATFSGLLAAVTLDERAVWSVLSYSAEATPGGRRAAPMSRASRTISCGACGLLLDATSGPATCPRCRARLFERKPEALRRTLALVIAGFVLYLPANILPILSIERFGRDEPNTILGGVRELIANDLWPLAVIVFTASVLVPLAKLFGLTLMLVMTGRHSQRWLVGRTRIYRFIDFIGRWSNIDLFMISLLVALVQFGALTRVRPEGGALAFAAVVVLTMIASRCFDPRIMWDAAQARGRHSS